jgi:class 3 adenylate cyclase/tetratricopeptide (TPR) repeat protein
MLICPSCGRENDSAFRFCPVCGAPIGLTPAVRRKLATVLSCDITGSTAMGARLDAERVRELMLRYFHTMRSALELHGGTVEKFIGDAVVAVFGVPTAHEDDALRACRAAVEMRARLETLNEEFGPGIDAHLALRIGLHTSEVVAGDASTRETFVTGAAANVAARLETAAPPGEILIGELTRELAGAAVEVESVPPIVAKGVAEPVAAYRLITVVPGPAARPPPEAPFIGRDEELARLEQLFEQAVADRRCVLATLVGEPGVGKSHLASELSLRLSARARVLTGRCLAYGEGITYWPLAEVVRDAAGIRDEDSPEQAKGRLDELVDPAVADRIGAAIGLSASAPGTDEIAWAFRKFFETMAEERPLLLLVEDIHWAEQTLLELLLLHATRAQRPILLLCPARPELLEEHPDWPNVVELEPLGAAESARLLEHLPRLGTKQQERVLRAAGGNPLFLEELNAFLREHPDETDVPPSLSALLAARLDRLAEPERAAAERGSIEGELFHRGAVTWLSAKEERPRVALSLEALANRRLIHPAAAAFVDEAAFRFKHVLIRDAAYNGTAKALRAELHESFAGWLERVADERVGEYEEILGFHLERAYRYREELGSIEPYRSLSERAAHLLGTAGTRAATRGDAAAATKLLERALALLREDAPTRPELLLTLGEARWSSLDPERATTALEAAAEEAAAAGRKALEGLARLTLAYVGAHVNRGRGAEEYRRAAEEWLPILEELDDERGLAKAWFGLGYSEIGSNHFRAGADLLQRALAHARRAGSTTDELHCMFWLSGALVHGPEPIDDALRRLESIVEDAGTLAAQASARERLGHLQAMRGHFGLARTMVEEAAAVYEELGLGFELGHLRGFTDGMLGELAGDLLAAERAYRWACETLEGVGETSALSTAQANLAVVLCDLSRYDEAEELAQRSETVGDPDDLLTQAGWRVARARVLARRGELGEAEELAREALEMSGDFVTVRGRSYEALAEVLALADRDAEAAKASCAAVELYERKGSVLAARSREWFDQLSAAGAT